MRDSGLANILCENELIIAQVVNKDQNLYRSLNITMGAVSVYDLIEAVPNENGQLELRAIIDEGIPHKELYFFKDQDSWTAICVKAAEHREQCIIQGLAMPRGPQPGVVAIAYEEGFEPLTAFGDIITKIPEERIPE
jgi:hypothetical protein